MFLNILVVCAVGLGQANQNNSNSTSGKNSNDEMHPEFKRTLMIAAIVMPVVLITFGCIGILWYSLVMLRYRSTDRYQRIGNGRPISHTLRLSGHPMRGTSKEKTVAMMKNTDVQIIHSNDGHSSLEEYYSTHKSAPDFIS